MYLKGVNHCPFIDKIEVLTIIVCGILGYPVLLIFLQMWALIWNHKKRENDFLFDFLPTMLGVEALGDAAPQTVLNGMVLIFNCTLRPW